MFRFPTSDAACRSALWSPVATECHGRLVYENLSHSILMARFRRHGCKRRHLAFVRAPLGGYLLSYVLFVYYLSTTARTRIHTNSYIASAYGREVRTQLKNSIVVPKRSWRRLDAKCCAGKPNTRTVELRQPAASVF